MDVFFEQILVKRPNTAQKIVKIAFILVAIVLCIALAVYAFVWLVTPTTWGSILAPICILAAFGVGFGANWYVKRMYLEYEYSITNGDFDIDRIFGKSKRERVISTSCHDFEEFGVYDEHAKEKLSHREFNAKVIAANLDEEGIYYAVVAHKTIGSVLVLIEPDERIKTALKKFIPRIVQNDVFGR